MQGLKGACKYRVEGMLGHQDNGEATKFLSMCWPVSSPTATNETFDSRTSPNDLSSLFQWPHVNQNLYMH